MKTKYMNPKYTPVLAAIVLGVGLVPAAASAEPQAEPATASQSTGQDRVADTTLKLEKAFDDQFVQGKIDRSALPIDDVIQAFPEEARPKVQAHIDQILTTGEKLAAQMTPEQRAAAVQPPAAEKVGKTAQAQLAAWGWPGMAGFGGFGAFGFPGAFGVGFGLGCGLGCGGLGFSSLGFSSLGFSSLGFGGLGLGGWFW